MSTATVPLGSGSPPSESEEDVSYEGTPDVLEVDVYLPDRTLKKHPFDYDKEDTGRMIKENIIQEYYQEDESGKRVKPNEYELVVVSGTMNEEGRSVIKDEDVYKDIEDKLLHEKWIYLVRRGTLSERKPTVQPAALGVHMKNVN